MQTFYIGYESSVGPPNDAEFCKWRGGSFPEATWINIVGDDSDVWLYNADPRNYAIFTLVTGVNEELVGTPISIYPNPATNVLNIEISKDIQQISLFNSVGQVVYNTQDIVPGLTNLDISKFTSGLYFLQISAKNGSSTQKVIIE